MNKETNKIIDEMNLDDEVKRIAEENLDYYRNNIYECSVDVLRVLYGELQLENAKLKYKLREIIDETKLLNKRDTESVKNYEAMRRRTTDTFSEKSYQTSIHKLNSRRAMQNIMISKLESLLESAGE